MDLDEYKLLLKSAVCEFHTHWSRCKASAVTPPFSEAVALANLDSPTSHFQRRRRSPINLLLDGNVYFIRVCFRETKFKAYVNYALCNGMRAGTRNPIIVSSSKDPLSTKNEGIQRDKRRNVNKIGRCCSEIPTARVRLSGRSLLRKPHISLQK